MSFVDLITNFLPKSYSQFDQIRAIIIISTSLAISGAMLLLILYWVATKSLETKTTVFVAFATILPLAVCSGFALRGQVIIGAWMLIILMVLINFLNMAFYGISSSSSAAYIIPILLATFCLGANVGIWITGFGCVLVFAIPILQFRGVIKPLLPFNISSLTFDAPVLTLIYLLVIIIVNNWVGSSNSLLLNS